MGGAPCCCTARRFSNAILSPLPYTGVGSARKKTIAVRRNHPPKQNAVCALPRSGQRGFAAQLFHLEHTPAARRSAPTAPAPSRQKSRTPPVIRPWFFARQIPAPPVSSCKKDFTTFLFQRLDSPFFAVIQYICYLDDYLNKQK